MTNMEGIFLRLREERERLGHNQDEFGDLVGVTGRTQRAYEAGKSTPDMAYLHGIASRGVDVYYLLSGQHEPGMPPGHVSLQRLPEFGPADGQTVFVLPEVLVQRKAPGVAIENLRWAFNPSAAMEPQLEYNALVLIDVTQSNLKELVDGATYAYSLWDRPGIRRVLHRRDHWTVVGYGKGADTVDVYKDDADGFEIYGSVVGVL
ncbi:hypothetical protein [Lysobacter sp. CA199]|uniref:hypothetical protein n=1 Tax=Lysobacter sp. CA199 TaxID=3455608 RepID=UPI003F8D86D7